MTTYDTLQDSIRRWLGVVSRYGVDLPEHHALALSGAGVRSYMFYPADNYNWDVVHPDVTWLPDTLTLDNYGAFQSLRVHTGFSHRLWNSGTAVERLAVIKREIEAGRMMLHTSPAGEHGVITGLTRDGMELSLELETADGTGNHHLGDFRDNDAIVAAIGSFITVAPEVEDAKPRRQHALKADILGWLPRHIRSEKELDYANGVYVASGARALILFRERYSGVDWTGLSQTEAAWVRALARELADGRRATKQAIDDGVFDDVLRPDEARTLRQHIAIWDRADSLARPDATPNELARAAGELAEADLYVAAVVEQLKPLTWTEVDSDASEAPH